MRTRARDPVRLRLRRAVGAPRRRRARRDRRPERSSDRHAGRTARRGPDTPSASSSSREGERVPFVAHVVPLASSLSPARSTPRRRSTRTEAFWLEWSGGCRYDGRVGRAGPNARSACSRRSPTSRRAASSPRRRRRCRSGSAASGTGTTATAGCATRRCTIVALIDRRVSRRGARVAQLAVPGGSPAIRPTSRSCTAWPASAGSPSSSSTGCRGSRARGRCGSGTPPRSSCSSTSTAR